MTDTRPARLFVGLPAPDADTTSVAVLADLTPALLARIRPEVVVLPLIGAAFDAVDALQRLVDLGYRGDVVVRTPALPDRNVVERELAGAAGALRLTLTGPEV